MEAIDQSKFSVKYRPTSLDNFFGQVEVVNKVKYLLENNQVPSTLLITGPTGAGKTTLSRIIAKAINKVDSISALNDIYEINIGANNTVECVENIVQMFNYKPHSAKHKNVYILDEVHTLTKASASSLLKIFEEPSTFNVFILCTNEPEKLLQTLKNRCYQIKLNNYDINDIKRLLAYVAEKEGFVDKVDQKVYDTIAIHAYNSPREALNLLQDAYFQIKSGKQDIVLTGDSLKEDIFTQANQLLSLLYLRDYSAIYSYINSIDCEPLLPIMNKANQCMLNLLFKKQSNTQNGVYNASANFYENVQYPYRLLYDNGICNASFKLGTVIQEMLLKTRQNLLSNIKVNDSILTYAAKICTKEK